MMVGSQNPLASSFNPQALSLSAELIAGKLIAGRSHTSLSPMQSLSRSASNSTLATATPIGSFPPGKATVKGTVGQGNPLDFMQVDLTDNSRMRLVLANRSKNQISVALLDATGATIKVQGKSALMVAGGQQGDSVFKGVKPGTYYLRVKAIASGTHAYEVNLFVNRTSGPAPLPCGCGV